MNIKTSLQPTHKAGLTKPARVAKVEQKAPGDLDKVELEGEQPDKDWTVLVWANGKANGADRLVPSVMRELEVAGSDENMDIVVQLGRKGRIYDKVTKDWSGTRRYHVERNRDPQTTQQELMSWFVPPYTKGIVSPVLQDLGKADMGSSASLSEFLQWGMKEYPAKNYAVVIYGEGGGMAGAGVDEETGHRLTAGGIEQAFREASKATGEKIDLVAFDGSHMGGIETAHQLKDVADIMVGSEASVNLGSIQLDMVMKDLKFELAEKGEVTPEQLAKWFVFETKANPGPLAALTNPTLSAIDLKKVDAVKNSYADLSTKLSKVLKENPDAKEAVRGAIENTQNYAENKDSAAFYGDYRDIGHFAQNLKEDARLGADVHKAADALIKATADSVIDNAAHQVKGSGLSAYLPLDAGYDLHSSWKAPRAFDALHGYNDTSVAQGSEWAKVFGQISEEGKFNARLRKLGLGNGGIVKLHKGLGVAKKIAGVAAKIATNISSLHGWKYARGKEPGKYLGIPVSVAVPLGAAGGAIRGVTGVKQIVASVKDDTLVNKTQAIIDGSIDTASAIAATTAAVGQMFPSVGYLKKPAGIVAVGAPFLKMGYGLIAGRKQAIAAKDSIKSMTPTQRLTQLESQGTQHHYVSPIVKFLVSSASAGSMDMSQAKA